jgi:hypothetical protein
MRKVLFIAVCLASFGLDVQLASAEKGRDCLADHAYCKALGVKWKVCLMRFDFCVKQNQKLGLNPYGNPARFGDTPGVLKNVPSVSIGKPAPASVNPGTAATTTINIGTIGAQTVNPGTAATTTMNAAPLSAPAKPPIAVSNGISGHAPMGQPVRSNFRAQ